MAELDVQPKKKSSWLPWLIAAIILLLLLFILFRSCNKTGAMATTGTHGDTSAAVTGTTTPATGTAANAAGDWGSIDRNAPAASYEELTGKNINVRGNDNYGIYSLGENILFDNDKSTIKKDAEQNLKQLAASINKRFGGGDVRIYGYTDSVGTPGYNKQLAQDRAEAVKQWLVTNGSITEGKISLNPVGEGQPIATNATEKGRQQNRRVEVVARKAQ